MGSAAAIVVQQAALVGSGHAGQRAAQAAHAVFHRQRGTAAAQHNYPGATLVTLDPGWVQTDMGGGTAPLTVEDSVRGLRSTLASVTAADKGRLLHHDGHRAAHW